MACVNSNCFCCVSCSVSRAVDGTSATLSSLQGVSSQMLRHQGPSLTPSLANYVRTDLIAHVMNWPADILEKQVRMHRHTCPAGCANHFIWNSDDKGRLERLKRPSRDGFLC